MYSKSKPIGMDVIINAVKFLPKNPPKTAEIRKVVRFKSHELFKLIPIPDLGKISNVRINVYYT